MGIAPIRVLHNNNKYDNLQDSEEPQNQSASELSLVVSSDCSVYAERCWEGVRASSMLLLRVWFPWHGHARLALSEEVGGRGERGWVGERETELNIRS